jgi:hypothetical protein
MAYFAARVARPGHSFRVETTASILSLSDLGGGGFASTDFLNSEIQNVMMSVYQAYAAANHGVYSGDPSEYLSFATTPEQQGAVQKLLQQAAARK